MRFKEKPKLNTNERRFIIDTLVNAETDDIASIKSNISDWLRCPDVPIVAATLDFLGQHELTDYQEEVRASLHHDTPLVQVHALMTLFDFNDPKLGEILDSASKDINPGVRLTAFALKFLREMDVTVLEKVRYLVSDDYDNMYLSSLMLRIFSDYLELEKFPKVVSLIRFAYEKGNPESDVMNDLKDCLDQLDSV